MCSVFCFVILLFLYVDLRVNYLNHKFIFFIAHNCYENRRSPSTVQLRVADVGPLSDFIDGLGPGQLVGRQVLGDPSRGDIQLSMCHQKGYLEVEVIRARGLQVIHLMFQRKKKITNAFTYS